MLPGSRGRCGRLALLLTAVDHFLSGQAGLLLRSGRRGRALRHIAWGAQRDTKREEGCEKKHTAVKKENDNVFKGMWNVEGR